MCYDGVDASPRPNGSSRRRRVLIVGGGFGGTFAARRLEKTIAKRADVEVVRLSRENYLLYTPMLHEVAAGDLYPTDIVDPLRKRLRLGDAALLRNRMVALLEDAATETNEAAQRRLLTFVVAGGGFVSPQLVNWPRSDITRA